MPPMLMVRAIFRSTNLHYYDFWEVLDRVTRSDGGLDVAGIFTFQNEHPTFVPGVLYWVSARFLSGSNHVLGLVVVVIAGVCAALLIQAIPRNGSNLTRSVAAVTVAVLVFSPRGLHNFAFSMSGIAWWSANLAALGGLRFASRGRMVPACALALVGSATYGTAFALWPVLAGVAAIRRDERWKIALPAAGGAGVVLVWQRMTSGDNDHAGAYASDVFDFVWSTFAVLGAIGSAGSTDRAAIVGALVTAVSIVALLPMVGASVRGGVPWVLGRDNDGEGFLVAGGLLLFTMGAAALMAIGRSQLGEAPELAGRYASITGLFMIGALLVMLRPETQLSEGARVIVCSATALVALLVGDMVADDTRAIFPSQELLAVALRLDALDAISTHLPAPFPEDLRPRLVMLKVYPFDSTFSLPCEQAHLGERLDVRDRARLSGVRSSVRSSRQSAWSAVETVEHGPNLHVSGRLATGGQPIDCLVVLDAADVVVGGGVVIKPDGSANHAAEIAAVARSSGEGATLLARTSDGQWYEVLLG